MRSWSPSKSNSLTNSHPQWGRADIGQRDVAALLRASSSSRRRCSRSRQKARLQRVSRRPAGSWSCARTNVRPSSLHILRRYVSSDMPTRTPPVSGFAIQLPHLIPTTTDSDRKGFKRGRCKAYPRIQLWHSARRPGQRSGSRASREAPDNAPSTCTGPGSLILHGMSPACLLRKPPCSVSRSTGNSVFEMKSGTLIYTQDR